MMDRPLAGHVALVTGASRGLGAATAIELARLGAHCVLTARTQGALEEVDDAIRSLGGQSTLFPLDLIRDGEKLDMVGPSIAQRFGRLDILVHAAGLLAKLTPTAHIMPRDWQEAVAVNLSAAWRLIRSADPPLRAAPAGRAVFLTDAVVAEPRAYWGLYGFGKAGQEHLARSWAAEVANTPLRVNLFDPGPVATRLRMVAMPGEDQSRLPQPADLAPEIAALCLPGETRNGAVIRRGG
ncbi:SDR family NAD(P)-dependent oxidoreductase [Roseicella frigidaeris]|uniref:Oxidoreductase n=2 Tax=Roseicella frigidaeris TaxID=2230885 RepID=A0A327MCW0_9PROT|nr:oxidoreductase [Roseicella frigidaeris]